MTMKILIIDDNAQNRYLLTYLLTNSGYAVIQAPDGQIGLTVAAEQKPDLVLLDIQLPDIDGYQVARNLKGNPNLAATPIVAVTSYAMVGDREKALAAGCTGYIEKPIDPQTFVDEIRRYLPQQKN